MIWLSVVQFGPISNDNYNFPESKKSQVMKEGANLH